MKKHLYFVLIISLLSTHCCDVAGQQQWPMSGACKERTSWASVEDQLQPPFDHVSNFLPDYSLPFHSLTILNNILCAGINSTPNMFYGIDMITKDTLWSFVIPESGGAVDFSAPQNDTITFVGGQSGTGLFCLDRYTGEKKWFRPMGSLYTKNAIIDENRLYIMSDSLFCLNIANGDTIWSYPITGQATPAVDESKCYITTHRITYAFNKITGEFIWKCYNSNSHFGQSLVDESRFYTSSADSIIARDKQNGALIWATTIQDVKLPGLETNFMAADQNVLAVSVWANADTLGQIYIFDKHTGEYKWHYTFGNEGAFCPTLANHVVYIVSWKEHKLYGFDTNTGNVLIEDDSFNYEAIQPVVYNHKLYVVASNSIIELGNDAPTDIQNPTEEEQKFVLKVYPTPTKDLLSIEYMVDAASYVSISICSITGEKTSISVK